MVEITTYEKRIQASVGTTVTDVMMSELSHIITYHGTNMYDLRITIDTGDSTMFITIRLSLMTTGCHDGDRDRMTDDEIDQMIIKGIVGDFDETKWEYVGAC